MSDSLPPNGLYSPLNSPGQNTGVGSHSLLQGIFPTQRSNPGLRIAGATREAKWIYHMYLCVFVYMSFPGGPDSKQSACNAEHLGSIPGLGRSPGEGKGYLL